MSFLQTAIIRPQVTLIVLHSCDGAAQCPQVSSDCLEIDGNACKVVIVSSQRIKHLLIPVQSGSQRVRDSRHGFTKLRHPALYLMQELQVVTSMTDGARLVRTTMLINPATPLNLTSMQAAEKLGSTDSCGSEAASLTGLERIMGSAGASFRAVGSYSCSRNN